MEPQLRPLTLGEILDTTASMYRSHFLLLAGIASVYSSVLLVFGLLEVALQSMVKANHGHLAYVIGLSLSMLVLLPVVFIAAGIAIGANNRAVSWIYLGKPATIRTAYAAIRPRIGRYVWLMFLTALIVYLPIAVLFVAFMAAMVLIPGVRDTFRNSGAAAASTLPDSSALMAGAAIAVLFGTLLLLALVYIIVMVLRYSLAVPACVVEDLKASAALKRSAELTKGARGRIFLLGLLVAAVQMGLSLIGQILFIAAAVRYHGEMPAWILTLQQFENFLINTLVSPIYATGFTLFYYDQRVRKEGFDIEHMLAQAGYAPALPAAVSAEPLA